MFRIRSNKNWWYNIRFTAWHTLESLVMIFTLGKVSGSFVIDFCSRECLKEHKQKQNKK